MRIAYSVHGYGRGHATRALAVLPALAGRHEVLVLAGGDAYAALHGEYPVVRIPTLKYQLGKDGHISIGRTLVRATPKVIDLSLRGPALEMVCDVLADFAPDVLVSDSEAWSLRAARRMGLPRISFDHYGVLVHCAWPMGAAARLRCRLEGRVYRLLMSGRPDRVVVASFYAPPPRREGVRVVGPVLREAVMRATPTRGDYLLVYFSNGHIHFTPQVERALCELGLPVAIYGTNRHGAEANLDFRQPDNAAFVADLASCRAVFSTAGNQLISEAMYFRKPMLLLPEDSFEQRLNAQAVETMGIGMHTDGRRVDASAVRAFLDSCDSLAANMPNQPADGRALAVETIERFAEELTGAAQPG